MFHGTFYLSTKVSDAYPLCRTLTVSHFYWPVRYKHNFKVETILKVKNIYLRLSLITTFFVNFTIFFIDYLIIWKKSTDYQRFLASREEAKCFRQKNLTLKSGFIIPSIYIFILQNFLHASNVPNKQTTPVLNQCWADVVDGWPTLKQHWINVSCLLGLCCKPRYVLLLVWEKLCIARGDVTRWEITVDVYCLEMPRMQESTCAWWVNP